MPNKPPVRKPGRKPGRIRRTKAEREALIAQMIRAGEERGYLRGVKEAGEKHRLQLADESLRVRLKLAEAYAEVFRSIANSANMLFDGGLSNLTNR